MSGTFSKGQQEQEKYEHYNKELCKYKKCYNCDNTGHPASHLWNISDENIDKNQNEKIQKAEGQENPASWTNQG